MMLVTMKNIHTSKSSVNSEGGSKLFIWCVRFASIPFYDLDNAEATTLTGQELIKFTKKIGNHFYNKELGDDKDYCIYIDTDSVFYSALPLVKKRFPTMDFDSETMMSKRILDVADEMQGFLNKSYDYFAKKFLNLDEHRFEIKQESDS